MHTASMCAGPTSKPCTDRCTVPQDRRKTAETIGWPNAGKADAGAEVPIKGLPTDSNAKQV